MTSTAGINLVWFKRDLRLQDHASLKAACQDATPVMLIYIFEDLLIKDPHYDVRHWRFVWESLCNLNQHLDAVDTQVHCFRGEAIQILTDLHEKYQIKGLFSHEETGILSTFERDKSVARWCTQNQVAWHESPSGAVIRGAANRVEWDKQWKKTMRAELQTPDFSQTHFVTLANHKPEAATQSEWCAPHPHMQKGGQDWAYKTLESFYKDRGRDYAFKISKPLESRKSCSRMSPYLAWGNMSLRQFYQRTSVKQEGKRILARHVRPASQKAQQRP